MNDKCILCDAPFMTVRAVTIEGLNGRRHQAHEDCALNELEICARRKRKPRFRIIDMLES